MILHACLSLGRNTCIESQRCVSNPHPCTTASCPSFTKHKMIKQKLTRIGRYSSHSVRQNSSMLGFYSSVVYSSRKNDLEASHSNFDTRLLIPITIISVKYLGSSFEVGNLSLYIVANTNSIYSYRKHPLYIQQEYLRSKSWASGCPNHRASGQGSSRRAQILLYRSMS